MNLKEGIFQQRLPIKVKAEINMVPFIDVLLVLLVILMAASTNSSQGVLDLPSMAQTREAPQQFIGVEVISARQIKVSRNGSTAQVVQITQLPEQVIGLMRSQDVPVVISAGKGVPYDDVAGVVSVLRQAGLHNVGLAFQPSEADKP